MILSWKLINLFNYAAFTQMQDYLKSKIAWDVLRKNICNYLFSYLIYSAYAT